MDIKGAFRVLKVKWLGGNVQYLALFLKDRIIFAKFGGQMSDPNMGSLAFPVIGGGVGGVVAGLLTGKISKTASQKQKEKEDVIKGLSADKLLKADKNNFEVLYKDIKNVEIKESKVSVNGARAGELKIDKNKFDIVVSQKYKDCEKLVKSVLGSKVKD